MRFGILSLPLLLLAGWCGLGQEPALKPGKLSKEELARLKPGLNLSFLDANGSLLDARRSRLFALHVPTGAPATPFLVGKTWQAKWDGYLKVSQRGDYQFRAVGTGKIALAINKKDIFQANLAEKPKALVELFKGYNRIQVALEPPTGKDFSFRLYWVGEGFAEEPVPPDALTSFGDEPVLIEPTRLREGRLLYATRGCVRCHVLPTGVSETDLAMPEMEQRPPSLANAGNRFQENWLAAWIENPRKLRPAATMPQVLHGDAAAQAADLAAYLMTIKNGPPGKNAPGDADAGERLFARLGCNSCHRLDRPDQEDPFGRLSLFHVHEKFQPGTLLDFLKTPYRHYPWIRMPDFKLQEKEAVDLAQFLQKSQPREGKLRGDAARGAKLFQTAGCAGCHITDAEKPLTPAKLSAPSPGDKGCLAPNPATAPNFGFKTEERQALQHFLEKGTRSLMVEASAEFSQRQVKSLQCTSCHRRDGEASRWQMVLEEDGVPAEILPILTWTGEKLKPEWTEKLLAGLHDHRARPWLKARMPAFPARAKTLAEGLSHEHGYGIHEDPRPPFNPKLAEIGKTLIPQQGGFNCIQCHGIGKQPPTAPFEAPGINLLDASLRLRYDYYPRWMLDPPRVDMTTRMQKFAADGKTTPLKAFDGDARQQYDAIWHFIQTLPK